jgi:hypothetical protein
VSQCDELRRHPHPKIFLKKRNLSKISAVQSDFYAGPAAQSPPSTTRPRWGSGAGGREEGEDGRNSHEGSRGIPMRAGGSRTARLPPPPPPPPSPASRASPEISSELELELESRGSFNFSFSPFFPPSSGEVASALSLRARAMCGPWDCTSRAGPPFLISYGLGLTVPHAAFGLSVIAGLGLGLIRNRAGP